MVMKQKTIGLKHYLWLTPPPSSRYCHFTHLSSSQLKYDWPPIDLPRKLQSCPLRSEDQKKYIVGERIQMQDILFLFTNPAIVCPVKVYTGIQWQLYEQIGQFKTQAVLKTIQFCHGEWRFEPPHFTRSIVWTIDELTRFILIF